MAEGRVQLERRGHVLHIGLDRATKRNAFDLPLWSALALAYGELERDPELRVGLLHAHGEHFTGGLDLPAWAPVLASGRFAIPEGGFDPLGLTGPRVSKPLVAALLLATDVRVAAATARFGQIEVRRGIYPVGGATLRFPREVGWANAMRWLLTGDDFDAAEALRIGLVQVVVEPGELLPAAAALAARIAEQAPLGVAATLASARAGLPEEEALAAGRLLPDLQPLLASEDMQEGLRSFLERRPGRFRGR
jgi:enoyl-CoA hydratase/carnithine racemase